MIIRNKSLQIALVSALALGLAGPALAQNPCAAKSGNPCAAKNPCAGENPCAAKK